MKTLRHGIKIFSLVAIVCCTLAVLQGCHKNKNKNTTSATYDFSFSGNTIAGYPLTFQSTAPASSTFLWDLGDGTTSTAVTPEHSYSRSDSFTVTLTVNKNSSQVVRKKIFVSLAPDPATVGSMAGLKYWHGYVIGNFQSDTLKDTISSFSDQFTISVLNSVTIVAKNDTLGCYYTDPANHAYYFRHTFSLYSWRQIVYYYNTNSFFYIYQPDAGGSPGFGPYSSATVLWAP